MKIFQLTPNLILFQASSIFGLNVDISRIIMSYLPPESLLNTAKCSKTLMDCLDMDMVVGSCLLSGKYYYKSIRALLPHMEKRSIYPLAPVRVLMMCCGTKCEFCRNGKTQAVRCIFGIKICWYCLQGDNLNPFKYKRVFTTKFNKLQRSPLQDGFFRNQFYLAQRDTLLKIFYHPRILAYPYGERYFSMDNDRFMSPTNYAVFFSQVSFNRYEVMWTGPTQDSFGNMTGTAFNRTMLKNSVQFIG
ncbi:MAG: F-box protein, partial [Desulfobacteraceae bacterium]|nr:F-box protein [Desulfobacteraceae bacterium]